MKRWVVGGLLAVAVALTGSIFWVQSASAGGTDVIWVTKRMMWNMKTTVALTGAARDTQYVTDEADSLRTDYISTSDWAWDAFGGTTTAHPAINIAYVTITVSGADNGVSDSLYFNVEKRVGSVYTKNNTIVAAGGSALLQGLSHGPRAVFRGPILYDIDSQETSNQVGPGEDFRLVIHGDVGGSSPKLSQCRVWITYPARPASR